MINTNNHQTVTVFNNLAETVKLHKHGKEDTFIHHQKKNTY